jgi:lipase chaperone LimK
MVEQTVVLTDQEHQVLTTVAAQQGKTSNEVLQEAVQAYLGSLQETERLALLRQARGMWKDRDDLPSQEALRGEGNRTFTNGE